MSASHFNLQLGLTDLRPGCFLLELDTTSPLKQSISNPQYIIWQRHHDKRYSWQIWVTLSFSILSLPLYFHSNWLTWLAGEPLGDRDRDSMAGMAGLSAWRNSGASAGTRGDRMSVREGWLRGRGGDKQPIYHLLVVQCSAGHSLLQPVWQQHKKSREFCLSTHQHPP